MQVDRSRAPGAAVVSMERFFEFSLLGLVASGFLAVAGSGFLDTPTVVLTALGLLLRALLIGGLIRVEISERATALLAISYALFFAIDYLWLAREFLACTVHMVCFLAVMRILTARGGRDYLFTAAIAMVELLAAALISINLNFFVFLALFLLFGMAALTSGEIRRGIVRTRAGSRSGARRIHSRLAALTIAITLGILVIAGALFFLLPRTADAALARLVAHRILLPGFSNQVTLGEMGEIKNTSRAVMHVRIYSTEVPAGLKWRGGALTDFDGKRWSNPPDDGRTIRLEGGQARLGEHVPGAIGLNYHVELNAIDTDALFLLGTPLRLEMRPPIVFRTPTDSYRLGKPPAPGFRYDAYSRLEAPPDAASPAAPTPLLRLEARERFLQLPKLDPRVPALARSFIAGSASDLMRARRIEDHLRREYAYTLELPRHLAADPLADFLFTRRKGHCEYFASAMTVMLRTLDIPARLVTGFQSGVWNPVTDLWVVRASDAHSWVEAWIPGRGWTTFDPTPPDPNAPAFSLLSRLALWTDAAETFWQEWIVSYDLNRQGTLSDKMEQSARVLGLRWFDDLGGLKVRWKTTAIGSARRYGPPAGVLLAAAFGVWMLAPPLWRVLRVQHRVRRVRLGQANAADATLLYERMLAQLKRRGYDKPAWFTPHEFARSLPASEIGTVVGEFTATYNAVRFGGRTDVAPRLSALLDELERQPR